MSLRRGHAEHGQRKALLQEKLKTERYQASKQDLLVLKDEGQHPSWAVQPHTGDKVSQITGIAPSPVAMGPPMASR